MGPFGVHGDPLLVLNQADSGREPRSEKPAVSSPVRRTQDGRKSLSKSDHRIRRLLERRKRKIEAPLWPVMGGHQPGFSVTGWTQSSCNSWPGSMLPTLASPCSTRCQATGHVGGVAGAAELVDGRASAARRSTVVPWLRGQRVGNLEPEHVAGSFCLSRNRNDFSGHNACAETTRQTDWCAIRGWPKPTRL